jgi:hypothetical protein
MTGGIVTVHKGGLNSERTTLDPMSQFAGGSAAVPATSSAQPYKRPGPIDLSSWGGLAESTEDDGPTPMRSR